MSEQKRPHWFPDYGHEAEPVHFLEPLGLEAGMRLRTTHELLVEVGEKMSEDRKLAGDFLYTALGLLRDVEEIITALEEKAFEAVEAEKAAKQEKAA